MAGYDEAFLGVSSLPLPSFRSDERRQSLVQLDYTHFSVLLHTARRLAASTGVNIDGGSLVELDRGDDWHLDPRVPATVQTGPEVYARNSLDRGHLVRRRDPVWGEPSVARQANLDSFSYTNAAPQASAFNQSLELWLGLETLVLDYAATNDLRLSVFTGPVLAEDDPLYRGVALPRRFWKIAVWSPTPSRLAAAGYILDQTPLVDDLEPLLPGSVPPLGPFRTFQVPIGDIAELTGLDLDPARDADVLGVPATRGRLRGEDRWHELRSVGDVTAGIDGLTTG